MSNPWEIVSTQEYEAHMKFIGQYDLLNQIFKEQVSAYSYNSIAILGIGSGNGLEHVKPGTIVFGYDINVDFLNSCRSHFLESGVQLNLKKIDLLDDKASFYTSDYVICNLVLEFIGLKCLTRIIKQTCPEFVSIVLQETFDAAKTISASPYTDIFNKVSSIRTELRPEEVANKFGLIGYKLINCKSYPIDSSNFF